MRLLHVLHQRLESLPKAQQAVIQVITDAPQLSVGSTVEQIAQLAGVSMPTVVRTCRAFGYANVREFMLALAQDIALSGSYLHRSVSSDDAPGEIVRKVLGAAISSMSALEEQIDTETLLRAALAIAHAERVDCYSAGATSTFITNDLQARLFRLGVHVNSYYDAHMQLISASTLGKKGVAIAVSHVGWMPTLLEATHFARSQGATVIALTQPDTELAKAADIVLALSVPEDAVMRVGMEAYIAHLLVIEILTILVGRQLGDKATRRLRTFRQVLEKHGIDSEEHMALKMAWSKAERET